MNYANTNTTTTRIFTVCQFEVNPRTGDPLADLSIIANNLTGCKSITEWAYCIHDKDVHTKQSIEEMHATLRQEALSKNITDEKAIEDYILSNAWAKEGDPIPSHIHIAGSCKSNRTICQIANWLGVPDFLVKKSKGKGAFLDCVKYLTHEDEKQQVLGKYLYPDNEVHANFDFRERLTSLTATGIDLSLKTQLRYEVMYNGMTLSGAREFDAIQYMNDFAYLKKCRLEYISNQKPPSTRINVYVDGGGGIGKNTCCTALAKCLYPNLKAEDCYFEIGGKNVSFEGYDGQPVLIWNDTRAASLLSQFGRNEVFDIFDSHPTASRHNVKYGSINLINAVNIVNGIQAYDIFLDGLAGEYEAYGETHKAEDKSQSYRRFHIILRLRENDFDILLNRGVFSGTRDFLQYEILSHISGSFQQIATHLSKEARDIVSRNMLTQVLEAINRLQKMNNNKISDIAYIPDKFKCYGIQNDELVLIDEINSYTQWWNEEYYSIQQEVKAIEAKERAYLLQEISTKNTQINSSSLAVSKKTKTAYVNPKIEEIRRNGYIIEPQKNPPGLFYHT